MAGRNGFAWVNSDTAPLTASSSEVLPTSVSSTEVTYVREAERRRLLKDADQTFATPYSAQLHGPTAAFFSNWALAEPSALHEPHWPLLGDLLRAWWPSSGRPPGTQLGLRRGRWRIEKLAF